MPAASKHEHERLALLLKALVDPSNTEIKPKIRRALELAGMKSVDIRLYEISGRLPWKFQQDSDMVKDFQEMEQNIDAHFDKTFRAFDSALDALDVFDETHLNDPAVDHFAKIHKRIFSSDIKFPVLPVVVGILIGSIIFVVFSLFIFDNDSLDDVTKNELPAIEEFVPGEGEGEKL